MQVSPSSLDTRHNAILAFYLPDRSTMTEATLYRWSSIVYAVEGDWSFYPCNIHPTTGLWGYNYEVSGPPLERNSSKRLQPGDYVILTTGVPIGSLCPSILKQIGRSSEALPYRCKPRWYLTLWETSRLLF
jgi:hypothetical protein